MVASQYRDLSNVIDKYLSVVCDTERTAFVLLLLRIKTVNGNRFLF